MITILITGASRGLGLEFTKQYLNRGDNVIATCRQPENAKELETLQKDFGKNLEIEQLDVTSKKSIADLYRKLSDKSIKINLLINNAGIISGNEKEGPPFGELNKEDFSKVYQVNTVSPILISEKFLPLLKDVNEPKIVNISSMSGSISNRTRSGGYAYSSSKSALNMMTKTLSNELKEMEITVVVIHPGWVQTDMGGENAPLELESSIMGIIKVIDSLSIADTGKFYDWQRNEIQW
ncbi:MAG: SDR family oxidoreductase [Candidatus Heimdallarchaeota archaeon]|nr:SDR family oxidoreductase [Candidatus Heimdallarchaeota archaeon]